jgi:tetratricopeptide (TPR) repeat protein
MKPLSLTFRLLSLITLILSPTCNAVSEETPAKREPRHAPLLSGLGELHHPVTTTSPRAQRYFNQGLALSFAFNHREAIRSFEAAAQIDPQCAMAFWGVALASGPHVNRPMNEEDNTRAWKALQQALALKPKVSPREQAYIDALAPRYQAAHVEDRAHLDLAFANAMRRLARQYPDDPDALTLFAEALMDTMPWAYWTDQHHPKPETQEVFDTLQAVLSRHPDHPGANHLYIHAVEAGPQPELGLPAADRLARGITHAGHLVHMPSHIYMRVGQYTDAVTANERAVKADRDYIRQCRAQGFYVGAYYPHNMHFLWWAQLFEGRSADSLKSARRVARFAVDSVCGPSPAVEAPRLRHLPWLTQARFGQWDALLRESQPAATNDFLVDRALWHFTRGLALLAKNQPDAAAIEHQALTALAQSPDAKALDNPAFPASATLKVADLWLAGRLAGARGDHTRQIELLQAAVHAEDTLPYMEPTFWPIPIRPALGRALLEAGQPERAEQVFRDDLQRWPRNAWGLLGLQTALRRQNKTAAADLVQREFEQAWQRADTQLVLAWF